MGLYREGKGCLNSGSWAVCRFKRQFGKKSGGVMKINDILSLWDRMTNTTQFQWIPIDFSQTNIPYRITKFRTKETNFFRGDESFVRRKTLPTKMLSKNKIIYFG